MKMILMITVTFTFVSCSTSQMTRTPSATGPDLSGTRLAETEYKTPHKGPNRPAVRIYLNKIDGEEGAYHAVLVEYASIPSIAPQYLASRKFPWANKFIGYLKRIATKIAVYKVIPSTVRDTYEMHPLTVTGDKIVMSAQSNPRLLTLSKENSSGDPLEGATVSSGSSGETKIYFPKKGEGWSQYRLAKLIYSKAKLDSTWRDRFLSGPYLAAYGKLDDVALKLSSAQGEDAALFINNETKFKVSKKKRASIFTSPKSAFLEGSYKVSEPLDGMFLLLPTQGVQETQKGAEHVVGRIGLFIDVFDATKSLNQDVVELALINPNDPKDFLMYYEHPENGDGGVRR